MNTRYIVLLCLFSILIDNVTSQSATCVAIKATTNNATVCNTASTAGTGYCCLYTLVTGNVTTYSCLWGLGANATVATNALVTPTLPATALACGSSRLLESILVLFGIMIISLF